MTTKKKVSLSSSSPGAADEEYDQFERLVAERVADIDTPLFTTNVNPDALWQAYLDGFPRARRQHYNCHSCRKFIQKYGGLVQLHEFQAIPEPLISLASPPDFFRKPYIKMLGMVRNASITGVFLSSDKTWGEPVTRVKKTGERWTHLHGKPKHVYSEKALTADQKAAEKLQDFEILKRSIAEFDSKTALEAVRLLKSGTLIRPEKVLDRTEWFADLHSLTTNQLWLKVATAPAGWCHVRSSSLATLLESIKSGESFAVLSAKWTALMDPLAYMRPTAAPKAGNIVAAEKLVEKLGVERSLARRFATLQDVEKFEWIQHGRVNKTRIAEYSSGAFSHIKPRQATPKSPSKIIIPQQTMTWAKFARDILPDAETLEVVLPGRGGFYGLTTAVHKDAPNLMQWDSPCSHYFYAQGSTPAEWGLYGQYAKVTAVFLAPHEWGEKKFSNHKRMAMFALEGARDQRAGYKTGLCMFPETMRSEYHGVRAVIESHSETGTLEGKPFGDANGLALQDGQPNSVTLRVDGAGLVTLDRFD